MTSIPAARRASAIVAVVVVAAVMAVLAVVLARYLLWLLAAIVCSGVAIAAAAHAVTRTGLRRLTTALVAMFTLVAPLVLVVAHGQLLQLVLLIALVAVAGAATAMRSGATSVR